MQCQDSAPENRGTPIGALRGRGSLTDGLHDIDDNDDGASEIPQVVDTRLLAPITHITQLRT